MTKISTMPLIITMTFSLLGCQSSSSEGELETQFNDHNSNEVMIETHENYTIFAPETLGIPRFEGEVKEREGFVPTREEAEQAIAFFEEFLAENTVDMEPDIRAVPNLDHYKIQLSGYLLDGEKVVTAHFFHDPNDDLEGWNEKPISMTIANPNNTYFQLDVNLETGVIFNPQYLIFKLGFEPIYILSDPA